MHTCQNDDAPVSFSSLLLVLQRYKAGFFLAAVSVDQNNKDTRNCLFPFQPSLEHIRLLMHEQYCPSSSQFAADTKELHGTLSLSACSCFLFN